MSRVTKAIEECRLAILKSNLSESDKLAHSEKFDLSFDEFCLFQDLKSLATDKALTLEESCQVFSYLGMSPEHFNKQPLEVKIVLTKLLTELMGLRL